VFFDKSFLIKKNISGGKGGQPKTIFSVGTEGLFFLPLYKEEEGENPFFDIFNHSLRAFVGNFLSAFYNTVVRVFLWGRRSLFFGGK